MIKRGLALAAVLMAVAVVCPVVSVAGETVQFQNGPIATGGTILCTGESVTGTYSDKGHLTTVVNDNTIRVNYHSNYKLDLEGTSGRKYVGRGVTNESFDVAPGLDYNLRIRNRLIAQGENGGADDFFFIQLIRVHVTPNGDIQQDFGEISIECK